MAVSVESLSLAQRVGQLFAVGFRGQQADASIRELLSEYHVGTVVYFDRNVDSPEQLAALSRSLQELSLESTGIPLLIATDQEGGPVSRIPFGDRPPSAMAVGATRDREAAVELGRAIAAQLRAVGITLDFAPVLDVHVNPDNPVIGVRSFGSEPELVGKLGTAVFRGLQDGGVAACGKHFPGHGDTDRDSHHELPVLEHGRDRLDRVELAPFRAAIDAGVDAIMTAHVRVPAVEPDPDTPATLSRRLLSGLLRGELGYEGLIVTDCMEMDAIADGVGTVAGAVQAVAAGADLVLLSHSPDRQQAAIEAVVEAVRDGRLPESRVDEAARRVLKLKASRVGTTAVGAGSESAAASAGLSSSPAASPSTDAELSDRTTATLRQAVTLAWGDPGRLPQDPAEAVVLPLGKSRTTVVEGTRGEASAPATVVTETLSKLGIPSRAIAAPTQLDAAAASEQDVLALAVLSTVEPASEASRQLERWLEAGIPFAMLAVDTPAALRAVPDASVAVATYDDHPAAVRHGTRVLLGEAEARGTLPAELSTGE